jgi:hypothetical protein
MMSDINSLELKTKMIEKFWANVEKTDYCWNWTGRIDPKGCPRFGVGKQHHQPRRISFQLSGRILTNKKLQFICGNKLCVNPDHLVYEGENKPNGLKTCIQCKVPQPRNNFFCKNKANNLLYNRCKVCLKKHRKPQKTNKEKVRARMKIYRPQYRLQHRVHIRTLQNIRTKERKHLDPVFKIRCSVSKTIWRMLKIQNSSKGRKSSLQYLSYTIDELKAHLESLFEPWMTWENWGIYNAKSWDDNDPTTWKWNIDHIIPQSDLPYTTMTDENFQKCWDLSNLRPLSAKQNHTDGVNRSRHKK